MLRDTLWQPLLSSQRKGMPGIAERYKPEGMGTNLSFLLSMLLQLEGRFTAREDKWFHEGFLEEEEAFEATKACLQAK